MALQHVFGAIIAFTCVACYYNSTQCDFVFDDISAIKENRDLRPHTPWRNLFFNDFWGTPMQKEQSHKSYRPLCVLTFRWNYLIHGLEPYGYHLVNILLHLVVSLLYFRMCTIFFSDVTSFVAALLFAVHPIHIEAVTGVVGRAETLSSVFFLLAFIFYVKSTLEKKSKLTGWKYLAISMISVATAMLCKEQGITVTAICAVYEIFVIQKISIRNIVHCLRCIVSGKSFILPSGTWTSDTKKRLCVLFLTTIGLLFARFKVMGSQLPVFTRFDNPASVAPSPTRQLTYNYLTSVNFWLLLFPCDLCCDWTMGTVPLVETFFDARNLATLATYSLLIALLWVAFNTDNQQRSAAIIMGTAFMVIPFIPASNLFFPVGFVIAERVLYMPSMGFCILIAYGFHVLHEKHHQNRKLIWLFMCILIGSHAIKTYHRNWDWKTEYTIFMSGLRVNQRNAKLFNNVGHALEGDGNYADALKYFLAAVQVQPDDVGAHINVGRTYNHLKRFQQAEEAFLRAKSLLPKAKPGETYQARIAPNHLHVFLNLANLISKNHTRLEEADLLYRQAISMRSDYTQAYINRGDILIKLNRTKDAQEVYERALLYDSTNPDIYYNLGVVLLEQGKASQALAYLDKALEIDPEHGQALLNSAILLQEFGRPELRSIARERLLKLLVMDDKNERVHFNMGMLAMDDKNIEEAENWFRRSVHLKHDFRSALFNLALLLADDQRPLEAASFLNQLVKYHPDHTKGLILLGDIYINHVKDLDAAENCYKRILQIDPLNIQGLHNLCVVYVERGKLTQALDCLQHAHKLAPQEDYILKHLKIVQQRLANLKQSPGMHHQKTIAFAKYDPKDFGGAATDNGFTGGAGNQREAMMMPTKSSETTTTTMTTTGSSSSGSSSSSIGNSDTTSTVRQTLTTSTTTPNTESSATTVTKPKASATSRAARISSENQKLPDDSTISLDAKHLINKNDQKINKNHHRYRNQQQQQQQFIPDNSLPMFVHDSDDPSSGTS